MKVYNNMMNSLLFLSYFKKSKAMSYTKTIIRTLLYQYLLLFAGLSIGFILNAEYIGWKSMVISRSINNIFFQPEYDAVVVKNLKNWGAFCLWSFRDRPEDFEIIEDAILAEEWYWAKFSYTGTDGKKHIDIDSTRIRWKPWEYYWENPEPRSEEELLDYLANGTINSNESDKAFKLSQELKEMQRAKKNKESLDK